MSASGLLHPGLKFDVAGVSRIQSTGPVLRFYDTDHDTHRLQMDLSGGNFRFYKPYTGSTDASHSEIFRVRLLLASFVSIMFILSPLWMEPQDTIWRLTELAL